MSEVVFELHIREIHALKLRDANFISSNRAYVVFQCGAKKRQTEPQIEGVKKHITFPDALTLFLTPKEIARGVNVSVFDYDRIGFDDPLGDVHVALRRKPDGAMPAADGLNGNGHGGQDGQID